MDGVIKELDRAFSTWNTQGVKESNLVVSDKRGGSWYVLGMERGEDDSRSEQRVVLWLKEYIMNELMKNVKIHINKTEMKNDRGVVVVDYGVSIVRD